MKKVVRKALLTAKAYRPGKAGGGMLMPGHPQREANRAAFMGQNHPDVPKVLYHGSNSAFPSFDRDEVKHNQLGFHVGSINQANHFASDPREENFNRSKKPNVMPVHIMAKNPLRLKDEGEWSAENLRDQLLEAGAKHEDVARLISLEQQENIAPADIANVIKSLGYDSVVYLNRNEGVDQKDKAEYAKKMAGQWFGSKGVSYKSMHKLDDDEFRQNFPSARDSYILFDPSQIKSATGNQGSFDPNEDDINKADGGRTGYRAGGYADPETKNLQDWQWRPLSEVQSKLGGLSEIPSHVLSFGQFMDHTAQRAAREGLRPRDLIKAYTITRASIQRQAINSDKLRAAGFDLPPNITGKIRPEGAFGEWLHSPAGQSYLDAAEKGQQHEAAIQNAAQVMKPFGKDNDLIDALRWAAGNLPGKEGQVSQLVAAGREKASTPDEWRAFTKGIRGIGPSKSGFVASLMGRGDQPTLDARQIILHTGNPAKEASRYVARKGGEGGVEAVNRLASRQEAMNLSLPEELSPYYQHLAHHAVWDKAGNEETTHQDVMRAMQHAATGGEIEPNHVSVHPLAQIMAALGFPGLETEAHKADGGEIDDWHGVHEREAQHFADGGVAGAPQKTVKAYKLFKTKKSAPGKLFPLFVDANTPVPVGQWVDAKAGEPGKTPGKVKSKLGDLAFRPGWHAGDLPIATHIGGRSSDEQGAPPDYRPADQVWAEVEMPDDVDWQSVANSRGQRTKAGTIDPKTAHITDQVPVGGHYRYKTNSNMTGNWMIGGSMRVNRILSDDEVKSINDAAGTADLPRHPDYPKMATGGRTGYADGGSTGKLHARLVNSMNFYSRGAEAARQLSQKKGSPQQMRAMLEKAGVKPEEFAQSGFDEAFSGKPSVTSEEIFQHFHHKRPDVRATQLLSREHDDYDPDTTYETQFDEFTLHGLQNYREHLLKLPEGNNNFEESRHWPGQKNVVAHIRMGDRRTPADLAASRDAIEKMRADPNLTRSIGEEPANWGSGAADLAVSRGTITKEEAQNLSRIKRWRNAVMEGYKPERVLHVEEIQSDWGQAGRKHGFQDQSADGPPDPNKPPQGPFVNSTPGWTNLALKHVLTEAVKGGYNKLVISPGQANADMYGLDEGRENGMKSYYDQIVPTQLNKLAKGLDPDHPGVQMFSHTLPPAWGGDEEGYKGHALEITDDMRDAVKKGLPMYKRGGMAPISNPMVGKAMALARNLTRR